MTKEEILQKLARIISSMDELILVEGEETARSPVLRKCRNDLVELSEEIRSSKSNVNRVRICIAIIKAVELLYDWVNKLQ